MDYENSIGRMSKKNLGKFDAPGAKQTVAKEIAAPRTEQGESVRLQIEEMMKPYLDMIKFQNLHLRYCRVGALRTQPKTQSQYKKSGDQLHADYPETVKIRDPGERPMSIIMALDEPFKFLYEDKDYDDYDDNVDEDDICELTVNKGHAIALQMSYSMQVGITVQEKQSTACLHTL